MADYEQILTVKNETFVYNIPPRQSNRGYRAADWTLDKPAYVLRMRVVAKGPKVTIKLEDKNNGELFAQCPVDAYPGVAVEPVMDSSRYFVLRIMDESGRTAFIGAGFQDRADSFDLNVALQDHFRMIAKEKEIAVSKDKPSESGPKLDLAFKEGQTIKLNITSNKPDGAKARNRPQVSLGGGGMLPPPPGSKNPVLQPPPSNPTSVQPQQSTQPSQSQSAANNWITFD